MRVPVVSPQGVPLMPTKPSRARRWLKEGKAVKKWSDLGVFYVQLTVEPSDTKIQKVAVGVDPGQHFSGIAVQSAKATLFMAHLILPFETVKKRMEQRRLMRRERRVRRIRRNVPFKFRNHRPSRFSPPQGTQTAAEYPCQPTTRIASHQRVGENLSPLQYCLGICSSGYRSNQRTANSSFAERFFSRDGGAALGDPKNGRNRPSGAVARLGNCPPQTRTGVG